MKNGMENALHADGLSPEIAEKDGLYDRLIGSWKAFVVDYSDDGSPIESTGEWHFGYILEGRAVQDVFIVPERSGRTASISKSRTRCGTSIRAYHQMKREWSVTWINPVNGACNFLIAKQDGDNIIQEGTDGKAMIRWEFTEIYKDTATWSGKRSTDNGKTWKLEAEFFLKRMS
ncbi:MAG: hypothetical protein ACT4O9_02530 [Blastocatellia bacterium]